MINDDWAKVQEFWTAASAEEQEAICDDIVCVEASTFEDQEALEAHITGMTS